MTTTVTASRLFMPGSFVAGNDRGRSHTTYNNVFQPPQPSPRIRRDSRPYRTISSISNPTPSPRASHSRAQSPGDENSSVRKRPRLDIHQHASSRSNNNSRISPNFSEEGACEYPSSAGLRESTYNLDFDIESPSPLVNTSYRFAGGLDVSNTLLDSGLDELSDREAEKDWRVNRYTKHNRSLTDLRKNLAESENSVSYVAEDGTFHKVSSPKAPSMWNGNGLKRSFEHEESHKTVQRQSYSRSGWHIRSTAWALTGGLAAKAINFCLSSAFGGFKAGGGTAYKMNVAKPAIQPDRMDVDKKAQTQDMFSGHYSMQPENVVVPGGFSEDHTSKNHVDIYSVNPTRAANRRTPTAQGRTSSDNSTLRNGWLLVDQPNFLEDDRPESPVRKMSRASVADTSRRSNSYKTSTSNHPQAIPTLPTLPTSGQSGASYASPRSRTSTSTSMSTSTTTAHHRNSSTTSLPRNPSPERRHIRPAPLYSPRRAVRSSFKPPSPSPSNLSVDSPISPEVKLYQRQIQKKEKLQDETMKRLNAQMKEMIKQGREALGTTYMIETEDDGDGRRGGDDDFIDDGVDGGRWR